MVVVVKSALTSSLSSTVERREINTRIVDARERERGETIIMSGNPFEQQRKGNEGDGGGAWDGSNAGGATVVRVNDDNDDDDATEFSNPFAPPPSDSGRDGGGGGSQRSGGGASPAKQQRATSSTNTNANAKKAADAYEAPTGAVARDSGMDTFGAYGGAYDNAAATTNAATTQQEKKGAGGLFGGGFGFGAFGGGGGGGSSGGGDKSLAAQRKELEKREADIARRERELAAREASMRANGGSGGQQVNNWPFKFWAFAYHNIDAEIPPQHQKAVRVCYYSYVCLFLALFMNLLAVTGAFITDGRIVSWLMAIIYFVVGVPGAYFIWYRRLYMAAKNDSGLKFGWFFLMYLGHLAFMVYACISPPGTAGEQWSLAGMMVLRSALNKDKILGAFYAVAFCLFMLDAVVSVVSMRLVWTSFRSGGHSASTVGAQMGAQAASGAAGRSALRSVV